MSKRCFGIAPIPTEKLGGGIPPNGKVGIREVVGINLATLTLTLTLNVLTKDTEQSIYDKTQFCYT